MRLGLLGGTFDPIHLGHLLVAEFCREQCRLDAVWFVPAHQPPHKPQGANASPRARLEMLELAIAGHPQFAACRLELERGGVSYTHETLTELAAEAPERELFLLMGADSLADLATWREPRRLCELALPVAVQRPGSPEPDYERLAPFATPERLAQMQSLRVDFPRIDLSSREIRRRVAAGQSIRYQTPRAVEKYIETQGLYRS